MGRQGTLTVSLLLFSDLLLPIESQTVEQLVTAGITTVAALISWWNNNSFTSAAIQADAEYARLKQKSE